MNAKHIKTLKAYRAKYRLELMQLETIRDLREMDGNKEEVELLNRLISERIECIAVLQHNIDVASGKEVA